jgi:hypothetical protein
MWNGSVRMMRFAGLGDGFADGDAGGVGDSAGVGEALAVGLAAALGDSDGEGEAWPRGWVQAASDRTKPTTIEAGTLPLHTVS